MNQERIVVAVFDQTAPSSFNSSSGDREPNVRSRRSVCVGRGDRPAKNGRPPAFRSGLARRCPERAIKMSKSNEAAAGLGQRCGRNEILIFELRFLIEVRRRGRDAKSEIRPKPEIRNTFQIRSGKARNWVRLAAQIGEDSGGSVQSRSRCGAGDGKVRNCSLHFLKLIMVQNRIGVASGAPF